MNKKHLFILIIIVLLGTILRLYKINNFPPSLYWDEVAIGYNAYSILETGRDEYGKFLPLTFESFQEHKLPGYIYSVVLAEKIFGVNELGVRFPAVIFGICSILVIYLIAAELFYQTRHKQEIALISALLFTISPWSLQFTRAGFEASGGLLFSLIGMWGFIKWLRTEKNLYISFISFIISLYFYYQPWVFVPLFIISVLFLNHKQISNKIKNLGYTTLFAVVLFLPLFLNIITRSSNRLSFVQSVFNQNSLSEELTERVKEGNTYVVKLVHNAYVIKLRLFIDNYFKYFSPTFLFTDGDPNPRHSVAGMGSTYLWMSIFFYLGVIILFKGYLKQAKILIPWLLIAPVTASLSLPSPHALRSLLLSPALDITSALGIVIIFSFIDKKAIKFLFKFLFIFIVFIFMLRYLHLYYQHAKLTSSDWADGHKQLYEYLQKNNVVQDYNQIYITGKYWRPYIFMLFYTKYSPQLYHQQVSNSRIGKYYFGYASYDTTNPRYNYEGLSLADLRNSPRTLLVLTPDEVKDTDHKLKTIYSKEGKPVFLLIESRE